MDLITEARKFRKQKSKLNLNSELKIAVIGTASIQYFVMMLDFQLHNAGIDVEIYEGEYNGITMDVFDDNSALYAFKPDIVIVLNHYTDIKVFPKLLDDREEINRTIDELMAYYKAVWEKISRIEDVYILQSNFVIPPEHLLGNLETAVPYSKTSFFKTINEKLVSSVSKSVTIVDLDLLSQYYGKYQWFDYKAYFMSKSGFKIDYLPSVANLFKKQIVAMKGKTKKCLVLDLDNTLWGGVVGDLGYDGIQLDPNNAIGEAYRYFQSYILDLKNRGVILAVCSKNDEANAKEPFEKNPNMILKLDDISCFVANWDNKADNIRKIAAELNIGVDSLVFFDDNPAEREIIRSFVPECHVVEVPEDPALYALQLDKENPFEWLQITKEDLLRNNSYIENRNRTNLQTQFVNYDDYLRALEMSGIVGKLGEKDIPRFTQLLNKSNQFNLRTQRYSEGEIKEIVNSDSGACIYVDLKDKFSEYGIISCVVLKKEGLDCFIESWVMSCRVLKRSVENFMFEGVCKIAKELGCERLVGEYIPSAKNSMVKDFYDYLGFTLISNSDGVKKYELALDGKYKERKIFIARV